MCENREKSYEGAGSSNQQGPSADESAQAIPSRGDFSSPGLGKMAGNGYGIAGAASERLSPGTPVGGRHRHAEVLKRLHYKQEQRRAIEDDIRELRQLLDLTSRPDFDALADYLTLGAKHGIF